MDAMAGTPKLLPAARKKSRRLIPVPLVELAHPVPTAACKKPYQPVKYLAA